MDVFCFMWIVYLLRLHGNVSISSFPVILLVAFYRSLLYFLRDLGSFLGLSPRLSVTSRFSVYEGKSDQQPPCEVLTFLLAFAACL